jgi:protein-disulfide isomerase
MIGCADDPSPASDGSGPATSSGADLVSSLEAGTMSGAGAMSSGPGPAGGGGGPQEIDIASLGYNDGPSDAPVRVLEFSDFGCGYCRRFHEESYPVLVQEYMDVGKVEWKYVPMILGMFPNAMEAARAGECAGEQGEFAVMRDLLFERQSEWKQSNDPEPLMDGYARELGLDVDRFGRCVAEGWRDSRIQAGTQLSRQVGVRGTPTFFVVGYAPIPGAIPLDLFRTALDTVYAEAMRESEGG